MVMISTPGQYWLLLDAKAGVGVCVCWMPKERVCVCVYMPDSYTDKIAL